jgi:hypothetical protein
MISDIPTGRNSPKTIDRLDRRNSHVFDFRMQQGCESNQKCHYQYKKERTKQKMLQMQTHENVLVLKSTNKVD